MGTNNVTFLMRVGLHMKCGRTLLRRLHLLLTLPTLLASRFLDQDWVRDLNRRHLWLFTLIAVGGNKSHTPRRDDPIRPHTTIVPHRRHGRPHRPRLRIIIIPPISPISSSSSSSSKSLSTIVSITDSLNPLPPDMQRIQSQRQNHRTNNYNHRNQSTIHPSSRKGFTLVESGVGWVSSSRRGGRRRSDERW